MTLIIEEQESIKGWEFLIQDFFTSYHKLTNQKKLAEILAEVKEKIKQKKHYAFCAFINNNPCGFILGKPEGELLEATSFYLLPHEFSEKCGFELITALTKKAFNEGIKFYRQSLTIPFNKEPSFEENLKKNGYSIFTRFEMSLNLESNFNTPIILPEGYSFEDFSIEKVDEMINTMTEANSPNHPDNLIYPEMNNFKASKELFGRLFNNFRTIDPKINPQIIFEGKIIGISFVMVDNSKTTYIADIAIHQKHQNKGLGKALMNKIIQACSQKNFKQVMLAVTKENSNAYELYKKLGFKEVEEFIAIVKQKRD